MFGVVVVVVVCGSAPLLTSDDRKSRTRTIRERRVRGHIMRQENAGAPVRARIENDNEHEDEDD